MDTEDQLLNDGVIGDDANPLYCLDRVPDRHRAERARAEVTKPYRIFFWETPTGLRWLYHVNGREGEGEGYDALRDFARQHGPRSATP